MRWLWDVFQPSNSLFLLAFTGAALWWAGRRTSGGILMGAAAVIFLLIVATPLPSAMMVTLETRFPRPELPRQVDGVISLGGAVNTRTTDRWGTAQLNNHVERITQTLALARRHPEATILFSGGYWSPDDQLAEADVVRMFMKDLGMPPGRVRFEDRSRTTWENGTLSTEMMRPGPDETWVLVTSAYHMPRAVGVFRRLGWNVIPYPVDYNTLGRPAWGGTLSIGYRLASMDFIAHEWAGLAVYRMQGKTSALFPR
jgi:uncharacterized SAM-binding protein YcdF (DUF218 family)